MARNGDSMQRFRAVPTHGERVKAQLTQRVAKVTDGRDHGMRPRPLAERVIVQREPARRQPWPDDGAFCQVALEAVHLERRAIEQPIISVDGLDEAALDALPS